MTINRNESDTSLSPAYFPIESITIEDRKKLYDIYIKVEGSEFSTRKIFIIAPFVLLFNSLIAQLLFFYFGQYFIPSITISSYMEVIACTLYGWGIIVTGIYLCLFVVVCCYSGYLNCDISNATSINGQGI